MQDERTTKPVIHADEEARNVVHGYKGCQRVRFVRQICFLAC